MEKEQSRRLPTVLTLASVALYVAALLSPSVYLYNTTSSRAELTWRGYETLLLGWEGLFVGIPYWLVNFALPVLIATAWLRHWRATGIVAIISTALAAYSYTCYGQRVPLDEAYVNQGVISSLGLAYYFWVASFAVWLVAFAKSSKESSKKS
jgi:hypothetical protein